MSFLTDPRVSNEVIEPRVDFENIPLSAIKRKTREKLSLLLNPEKVLRTEDGYFRDWRGLFSLSDLTQSEYALISESRDKTSTLLELWLKRNKENNDLVTLSRLQECLGLIDRYDVYDDTHLLFIEDAKTFLSNPRPESNANSSMYEIVKADPENDVIVVQDVESIELGLPLKIFDAFLIYHEKDVEFATELIERCENMGHSLCIKDRDLLGGFSFESDVILKLLANRCHRLIIIVSKAFLKSPMQIFITNFAQSIGIEQNQRKIIPILLEPCDLPQMLRYCFRFDYYKNSKIFDFWDRLDKTIKTTTLIKKTQAQQVNRQTISEIDANSSYLKESQPTTPNRLYDDHKGYKFTETPTPSPSETSKRSSKIFSFKKSSPPEETKQIWPPTPKLRPASSMVGLNVSNSDQSHVTNKLSQSSFYINKIDSPNEELETNKSKRKKWYKIFLPPSSGKFSQERVLEEMFEDNKPQRDKRPWYKIKKKKSKQKNEIAIACEN